MVTRKGEPMMRQESYDSGYQFLRKVYYKQSTPFVHSLNSTRSKLPRYFPFSAVATAELHFLVPSPSVALP